MSKVFLFSLTAALNPTLLAATTVMLLTVVAVNLIMLALLELPLLSYALAPAWTPLAIERFKGWLASHGGRAAVIVTTMIGLALVLRGVLELSL